MGDTAYVAQLQQAYETGINALYQNLWNGKYFRAFGGANITAEAVMADSLYGQVWAFTLGLGNITDTQNLLAHLMNGELEHNDSPYGLLVMTGRNGEKDFESIYGELFDLSVKKVKHKIPTIGPTDCNAVAGLAQDDSIWMGGSPDWSVLNLWLGTDVNTSLSQAQKGLATYNYFLNDPWDVHGILAGMGYGLDGQYWCTAHYGFHMVLWHLPLALSGQYFNAINGTLQFNPVLQSPYQLPFFVPNYAGLISNNENKYSLTLLVGNGLSLNKISISGITFPNHIVLSNGQTINW